jgi:hypothetical protein
MERFKIGALVLRSARNRNISVISDKDNVVRNAG